MNVAVFEDSITLSQPSFSNKGLELLNMTDCKPVKTPLTPGLQMQPASTTDHEAFLALKINYHSYTGMLNYLACRTRPDLALAVSMLSYRGLLLKPKSSGLNERSLAFWKAFPISWNSKKQKKITMSSTESELNALLDGEQENQWLSFLIEELWRLKLPATLDQTRRQNTSISRSKHFTKNTTPMKLMSNSYHLNICLRKVLPKQHLINLSRSFKTS
ncbi:hypothetical protein VP01_4295g1, partial [Puccinia sorghi]